MPDLPSAYEETISLPLIPVWCSLFTTCEPHQANELQLDANRFVLCAEKPFQEGALLFVRMRSFPCQINSCSIYTVLRSASIMEVKWCRKSDEKANKSAYEMGVAYVQPYV